MKTIFNHIAKGTLLGASLLLGVSACTDDHFDISDGLVSGSGANTVWENIAATPQLDSLRQILSKSRVMRTVVDRNTTNTYASLLNSSQTMNVWAPIDGTYPAYSYLEMLDQAKELRAAGDIDGANKLEYRVASQFVQNHLSRYNYESNPGQQEVRLLNFKRVSYDAAAGLFNRVPLLSKEEASAQGLSVRIPSSNGMLHLLSSPSPYTYNLYDLFLSDDPRFTKVREELAAHETIEFSESMSTPGTMNPDGQMEYADSVYTVSNSLLTVSRAQTDNEDSIYVAVVPTDACYDAAIQKLKSLYKFARSYKTTYVEGSRTFTETYEISNPDSLAEECAKERLFEEMYFSPSFMTNVDRNDSASIINYMMTADSLRTSSFGVYYNPNAGTSEPNSMFAGHKIERSSNGYVIALDEFTIDPAYSYLNKLWNSAGFAVLNSTNSTVTGSTGERLTLTSENRNDTVIGGSENYPYTRFVLPDRGTVGIYFRLPNVCSTKYRISVVCLPSRANLSFLYDYDSQKDEMLPEELQFSAAIVLDDKLKDTGRLAGSRDIEGDFTPNITIDQDSIKEYVLFEDFEFPRTYSMLPSGVQDTFPLLYIEFPNNRRKNCKGFNISNIILRPVSDQ